MIPAMFTRAMSFTVLRLIWFFSLLLPYPEFVRRYYNFPNLLGIFVLGVPIEQLLFAAASGAIWSVAYDYAEGYRLQFGLGK